MTRSTRSNRQSSRSPNRWGDLIDPRRENDYDNLFAQQRALLAAVDAVPTPNSPAVSRRLGDRISITSEDLDAAIAAATADFFASPNSDALQFEALDMPDPYSDSERASVPRRSRSATPAQRRVPVGPTPTLSARSPPVARRNGDFFDLPANYFDSSPPRARSVSAVAGGEASPRYTPVSPAYDPTDDFFNFDPPRSPARDAVGRRLDEITETLGRLHRRVMWRSDRIDAQLMVIVDALRNQRNGAPPATPNDRKRKRSVDGRDVVDLTGATPSPKKVDFVDLVTDSSWSGSRFSSDSSTSSSDSSSSEEEEDEDDDDDDDDDADKQSTPSKKPKPSPNRSPSSPRSPKTPPNNRTPSPPRTPRKAPPRRPLPRTPPRQRAPSRPSTPPAPQAPRTPPQQTAPARPATPPAPRRSARIPKSKQREVEPRAPVPSRVTTRGQAAAKKAARKPRPNPTTYVRRKRT